MAIFGRPFRLYLDQKDWIDLSRRRLGRSCHGQVHRNADALAAELDAGRLIVPFSQSHVLETGNVGQPTKRFDVAMTIILLSRRHALAPLHALWVQEADAFFEHNFGVSLADSPQPFGKGLAFALGFAEHEVKLPWTAEADIALGEAYAIAEPWRLELSPEDVARRDRWKHWADFFTATSGTIKEDRDKYNEQDRLAALMVTMLHREMIGRAIVHDVQDRFLEFLRDAGPWAVIREMPSLAVYTELLRARYPDTAEPWTSNDYHDMHFLSAALAYCDAVCPDHRWADLARRSEYIGNRGTIITSGRDAVELAITALASRPTAMTDTPARTAPPAGQPGADNSI